MIKEYKNAMMAMIILSNMESLKGAKNELMYN